MYLTCYSDCLTDFHEPLSPPYWCYTIFKKMSSMITASTVMKSGPFLCFTNLQCHSWPNGYPQPLWSYLCLITVQISDKVIFIWRKSAMQHKWSRSRTLVTVSVLCAAIWSTTRPILPVRNQQTRGLIVCVCLFVCVCTNLPYSKFHLCMWVKYKCT